MQTNNFQLTTSGSGYWIPIVILLAFLIVLIGKGGIFTGLRSVNMKEKLGRIMALLLFLVPFLYEVSWLAAKTIINVDAKKMTVTESFYGIPFTKTYDISKISNLKIEHNVGSSWRNGRFGNGIPLTNDPTVLYFDYDGDTKCIGKHCNNFNAELIIKEIKGNQNTK